MKRLPKLLQGFLVFFVGIIVISAVFAAVKQFEDKKNLESWRQSGAPSGGVVVVADREISKDSEVDEDDIYEMKVHEKDVPVNAILCKRIIVGQKIRATVNPRKILKVEDFYPGCSVEQKKALEERSSREEALCKHKISPKPSPGKNIQLKVVVDVPEGEKFTPESFREEEEELDKIPGDAIRNASLVVNQASHWGTSEGQLVTFSDIRLPPASTVYRAVREIKPGEVIWKEDIKSDELPRVECPLTAVYDLKYLMGKKAIDTINSGKIIKMRAIE